MTPLPIAVLLSGGGTTLQNLLDRIDDGTLPIRIVRVLSNRAEAFGLERARRAEIPHCVIRRKDFADVAAYSREIFLDCVRSGARLVCMAGFLQLLWIPPEFENRVLNIHPALLPAFGGKGMYGHHVHETVIEAGVKISGCTVHFADNEYDHGPIVLQRPVPVLEDDTPASLAARVFEQECIAYPEALRWYAEGRLRIEGRRVLVRQPLQNPPGAKGETMTDIAVLIEAYAAGAALPCEAIADLTARDLDAEPVPGTWSLRQIIVHLMDSDLIASERMKRVIATDNPVLLAYDEASFARNLGYETTDAYRAANVFELNRQLTADLLRRLPAAAWQRVGKHSEKGPMTLRDLLELYSRHLEHHLAFVRQKRELLGKMPWPI